MRGRAESVTEAVLTAGLLLGCSCSKDPAPQGAASAPPAPIASAAPSAPASVSVAVPESVVPPPVDAGPPRRVVRGEGISIVETGDGQVIIKSTSLWNEPIETTYAMRMMTPARRRKTARWPAGLRR